MKSVDEEKNKAVPTVETGDELSAYHHVAVHAVVWRDRLLADGGNRCGNCRNWRGLRGCEIEQCRVCGDDAYDVIEVAEAAEELP